MDRRGQHFQNVFLGLMVSDSLDRLAESTELWPTYKRRLASFFSLCPPIFFLSFFFFAVLVIEPRASHALGKYPATELYFQP